MRQWEVQWKDYYKILQVSSGAQLEVIKAAYGKLAQLYHPDKNSDPNACQQMVDLNEAYACLSSSEARAAYDQHYTNDTKNEPTTGGPKPIIEPASLSIGILELDRNHTFTFRAENLGDAEQEQNEIDYWPKLPWLNVRTDGDYLPVDILVEINTSGLQLDTDYSGEIYMTLDGITTKAQFTFHTLDITTSLERLLGAQLIWAK